MACVTNTCTETAHNDLLGLQWPSPPRNVLVVRKAGSKRIDEAVIDFCKHVQSDYPSINLVLEPRIASTLHESLEKPIYSFPGTDGVSPPALREKVDLLPTMGGDGTILHASSLFATAEHVPPILSFSMGTLGFLGEWKFQEHKRAFREVYMSGAADTRASILDTDADAKTLSGWSSAASPWAARAVLVFSSATG